ncbi:hypothetical protein RND81_01G118400 [Saponaria officinalis]|uniref:Secreted protein n=1 Tax=Saponaria officinalis TaxID=3572 RepID=A0AAW1NGD0_SAPOF
MLLILHRWKCLMLILASDWRAPLAILLRVTSSNSFQSVKYKGICICNYECRVSSFRDDKPKKDRKSTHGSAKLLQDCSRL